MKLLLKIFLLFLINYFFLFGYSSSDVSVIKYYDSTRVLAGDSIIVTIEIQNFESEDLRGFFYTEFLPEDLIINPLSVKIDRSEVDNFIFEMVTLPVYDSLSAYRWILETPPDFNENNTLLKEQLLEIKYSISTEAPDTFYLGKYNWAGYYLNIQAAFGYNDIAEVTEIIFINQSTPVELTLFRAELLNNEVVLKWITASSNNNYGFIIEKSISGLNSFKEIGFIPAKEDNFSYSYYEFRDKDLTGSLEFFYRLKQIDLDGSFSYVDQTSVKILQKSFVLFQNYPNPFNPSTTISFFLPKDSYIQLIIYNFLGEMVHKLIDGPVNAGYHKVIFDNEMLEKNLSTGTYFYHIKTENFEEIKKFLLIK